MIRAIRPNAMAQDDSSSLVTGWNVAPNVAYVLILLPGASSCGVLLYSDDNVLIATGAALVGTAQPCVLIPQTGQAVEMVDSDLGWHLLLTTTGTESQRTIRIGPAVDLPDEIHPVYGDDDMALARATAAIDAAAHYIDDVTVTCPLGLGAGLGDVVSVPVDGQLVVGQVESITWTATPDGTSETAVIRRHVAIAPEAFVEPDLPTVADDTGTASDTTGTSGNVLTNDAIGLTVVAVNGLAANVGQSVGGDNGGSFVINADGQWTFDPEGDFALLAASETADTSVTYHASDGTSEAMATLTVTVSRTNAAPVAVDDTGETDAATMTSGNVLTNDTDADLDTLVVSQVDGSAANVGVAVAGSSGGLFTIGSDGAWTFDPDGDFDGLTGDDTATTSVTYHVSDGVAEDEGTLTATVTATVTASLAVWTPAEITTAQWLDASDVSTITDVSGSCSQIADKSGNGRHETQGNVESSPIIGTNRLVSDGTKVMSHILTTPIGATSYLLIAQVYMVSELTTNTRLPISLDDGGRYGSVYAAPIERWQSSTVSNISLGAGNYSGFGNIRVVNTPMLSVLYAKNIANVEVKERINGVEVTSKSIGASWYLGSSWQRVMMFMRSDGATTLNGEFYESVVIDTEPTFETILIIEGYMAHKWGELLGVTTLVDNLPSDHPYKSAPPYLE